MASKKGNKDFLSRINRILGERAKHPWGDALGLKNTRIQSIFQGQVPTADALEIIHRAEKVRVDWLLTGHGPPFFVEGWLSDEQVVVALGESSEAGDPMALYLLTDGQGRATVVTTRPIVREYEWGAISRYTDVSVYPYIGPQSMEAVIGQYANRLVSLDEETFMQISNGWKGPVDLLGGLLEHYSEVERGRGAAAIREAVGRFEVSPRDEAELLSYYRHLRSRERDAVITLLSAMGNHYDVMQRPQGTVMNPDVASNTKGQSVRPDGKVSATNKLHSDD